MFRGILVVVPLLVACGDIVKKADDAAGPTTSLPAPQLTATPNNGQVTLEWNAVEGADTYLISQTSDGQPITHPLETPATSALIEGLANGTTYRFAVQGKNAEGLGALSDFVEVTPSEAAPLATPAPSALFASSTGSRVINLSWTAPPNIDGLTYQVYRGTSATGPFTALGSPSLMTSETDIVANGVQYSYVVRATGTGRTESVDSNVVTTYATQTPVLTGGGTTAPNWLPTDDAAGYILHYKYVTPNFDFRSFPTPLKVTFTGYDVQNQQETTTLSCTPSYTLVEHQLISGRHSAKVTNGEACYINPCYFQNVQVKVQAVYASGLRSAESNVITGFYNNCD